jgi:hypothetical protein
LFVAQTIMWHIIDRKLLMELKMVVNSHYC